MIGHFVCIHVLAITKVQVLEIPPEIGRLPREVNSENTYKDGDSLRTPKGPVKATEGAQK